MGVEWEKRGAERRKGEGRGEGEGGEREERARIEEGCGRPFRVEREVGET